ncbi:hypothetical protein AWRI1631_43080 [Saccharomyces cerevisiae AWRI1631]|uniref:Uncharacterized protein n=1 Tax=Saccharomyces cerevisiae (strain AWRI1631) TaxID=545124 RepID=B5VFY5_YEAS6|nr:hypothetical protein AWRI1631_43080 [Saccharomyces cerevisiae AWRI1631]
MFFCLDRDKVCCKSLNDFADLIDLLPAELILSVVSKISFEVDMMLSSIILKPIFNSMNFSPSMSSDDNKNLPRFSALSMRAVSNSSEESIIFEVFLFESSGIDLGDAGKEELLASGLELVWADSSERFRDLCSTAGSVASSSLFSKSCKTSTISETSKRYGSKSSFINDMPSCPFRKLSEFLIDVTYSLAVNGFSLS